MARKIPVRKHRGVRDPLQQKREREAKLKHVLDAPPKEKEKIPKKVRKISELRQQIKDGTLKKGNKRRKKQADFNSDGLPLISAKRFMIPVQPGEKVIPQLSQQQWETDKMFYERFQRLTNDVIKEAQFESKFKMKVVRDEKGAIESLEKAHVNEVDKKGEEMAKEAKLTASNPKKAKKMKAKAAEKAAKKADRILKLKSYRKMKQDKRKQKLVEKNEDAPMKDKIKFGEVVHRPPEIKTLPRRASDAPKDLRSLMFNQMLLEGKRKEEKQRQKLLNKTSKDIQNNTEVNLKGKWKHLPVGHRRILEDQQKNAVAAYRLMKVKIAQSVKIK